MPMLFSDFSNLEEVTAMTGRDLPGALQVCFQRQISVGGQRERFEPVEGALSSEVVQSDESTEYVLRV